jgi:hypothetical protein
MIRPFTRESISATQAQTFIYVSAAFSAFYAIMTSIALAKGIPGFTRFHILDIVFCVAIAFGIVLRVPAAAWVGLVNCGLHGALRVLRHPAMDPSSYFVESIAFGMAIISIGLYPSRFASNLANAGHDSGTTSGDT